MKKEYLEMLDKMIADPEVEGKGHLRKVRWLNTTEPRYSIGQFVSFTDKSVRLFGNPIIKFGGKIIEVRKYPNMKSEGGDIRYTLEVITEIDGVEHKHTCFSNETEIEGIVLSNVNHIERKSKYSDSIDAHI